MKNICTIEGCGRFVAGRGFCKKHYARLMRHGTSDARWVRQIGAKDAAIADFVEFANEVVH